MTADAKRIELHRLTDDRAEAVDVRTIIPASSPG